MPAAALTSSPRFASLRGRVVLVTGGSGGLAAAIAVTLGAAGMRLVLADNAVQPMQDCLALLAERDIDAVALPLDGSDPENCAQLITSVAQRFGRLDVLVNNGAIDIAAPVGELSLADWQRIVATNLSTPFMLSKHAAALMASQGEGHIINITTTAAKRAGPHATACDATHWGLLGLSHALRAELRPRGIKVTAVVTEGTCAPFPGERSPAIDDSTPLQDPMPVAQMVRYVLQQRDQTSVAEVTVLPMREASWA